MPKSYATTLKRARVGADRVRLGCGDDAGEIAAVGAAVALGRREQRLAVSRTERARERARGADVAGESPRVDAGDRGNAVAPQEPVDVVGGPPVRRAPGEITHDDTAAVRRAALRRRAR